MPHQNGGRGALIAAMVLGLLGCNASESESQPNGPGCSKDTDCKGDRICEGGTCMTPGAPLSQATDQAAAPSTSSLEVCKPGDDLTRIPVWKPNVDKDEFLDTEPPQRDGQVTYIDLTAKPKTSDCLQDEMHHFLLPDDKADWRMGGLQVIVHGVGQLANGSCTFRGYYMNEGAVGMNQGYLSTVFKPVAKEEIILSGRFCLGEPVD